MNIAIRVALVITTLICAFCAYLINDYRGRLKTAELALAAFEKKIPVQASQSSDDLVGLNKQLENELKNFKSQSVQLINQVNEAVQAEKTAREGIEQVSQRLKNKISELENLVSERDSLKEAVQELDQLEKDLAAYQALGTVAQLHDQINAIRTKPKEVSQNIGSKEKDKPRPGTEMGVILSVDSKLGFCVVNFGSAKGVVKGDEFHIHRAGNFVGKIKVDQVQPAVSLVVAIKKFTPKELRAGDKVIQGQ